MCACILQTLKVIYVHVLLIIVGNSMSKLDLFLTTYLGLHSLVFWLIPAFDLASSLYILLGNRSVHVLYTEKLNMHIDKFVT